ncbi:Succinate dehydrogenase/fumarate reductase, flavoprotein subunit [Octadecabacter temperatus]|uniref:L-aspartate oxidase n=1 Tax=Octadecabacter temperatus TaxID=1458307 RepID=A0A0K0Y4E2_9RHOB|nr:FAD-binding protein [Octadecabacter temperatus]AKS45863.1 L-aspartate oxidase [Octadecabacter temperatus]SIO02250.1 Succinate dehydrogenase/fumarate reductase, flavoprotein subunit [Octadecabacter temperatus]
MTKERVMKTDVLVIGGGIAGGYAAIKAADAGASVTLIDKGYMSRSGQSPYVDSFLVFNEDWGDNLDEWMDMIGQVGEHVNHREWTKAGFVESHDRYEELVEWGVEFAKHDDGTLFRKTAKLGPAKTLFMEPAKVPTVLREQALARGVNILYRRMINDLLVRDGKVVGAVGFGIKGTALTVIECKSVVLATGASGMKGPHWPIHSLTGDGDAMAYRAGASITGKEFMDPHPTSAEKPADFNWQFKFGGQKLEDKGPPQGHLTNAEGDVVSQRGTLFLELEFEAHAGRAPIQFHPEGERVEGRTLVGGGALGMSIHKAEGVWAKDMNGWSGVPGLYAAGDALGSMASGATYAAMGLSSANCTVTGARAGTAAAVYAATIDQTSITPEQIEETRTRILAPMERKGGYSPGWVTNLLQGYMMPYFVLMVKDGDRLQATLTLIEFMRDHLVPKMYAKDAHELRLVHETANMVLNAEMRLRAGLFRTESRGCHYREDFPSRDDDWLAWVLIGEQDGKMVLEKELVPDEWKPDLSRPYVERYEWRLPNEVIPTAEETAR